MKQKQLPFYLTSIAIFFIAVSPKLFSDGMFMDGLIYATVANNLAQGIGSFWDLSLTKICYPHFFEHPPLVFGIQSLFFKIFGSSMFVERIYSLLTFIITALIIKQIWNKVVENTYHKLGWLPLLIWISIPLVTWSAPNNMLENTMMIFTSLSVLFFLKGVENEKTMYLLFAGVMLALGALTKGLVALFPLSLLFWYYVFNKNQNFKQIIYNSSFVLLGLIGSFVLLFVLVPESFTSLSIYFKRQIIESITITKTVNSRFYILWRLFNELIPSIIVLVFVWLFSRKHQSVLFTEKWFLIFLMLGLSGVIPIMVSLKQSGFYMLAALPIFSIAFAFLIRKNIAFLIEKINVTSKGFKIFSYGSVLLIILSISLNLMQINKIGRDAKKIEDVYRLIEIIPEKTTISLHSKLRNDWSLHGYFQRYGYISLDTNSTLTHKYILTPKKGKFKVDYKKVPIPLNNYNLFERIEKTNH